VDRLGGGGGGGMKCAAGASVPNQTLCRPKKGDFTGSRTWKRNIMTILKQQVEKVQGKKV